jgi:WD40 repeat protein
MSKLAILRLQEGDLKKGIHVVLTIRTLVSPKNIPSQNDKAENLHLSNGTKGDLPPNPQIGQLMQQWRDNIEYLVKTVETSRLEKGTTIFDKQEKRKKDLEACLKACQELEPKLRFQLNSWLQESSFHPICKKLAELAQEEEVRILVRTANPALWSLPWQLWDLIEQHPTLEIGLSTIDTEPSPKINTPSLRGKVKILTILGTRRDKKEIDIEKDKQIIQSLPNAELTFLEEPKRSEINDELWDQAWDILFFAGHSCTEGAQKNRGKIYINRKKESLTIDELRYSLTKAVGKGLKIAIFNSCDGLGLAFELQQLNLPQVIVMREPVLDNIAHEFLRHFLSAYTNGQSLYLAERSARMELRKLEKHWPGASWLPMIVQSPMISPPSWIDLGYRPTDLCPYRGLLTFREEDAPFFFGREEDTQKLIREVQEKSFVSIIEASGSGKSSVVFAGLIPQLRQQGSWQIAAFRPGEDPFDAIARAFTTLRTTFRGQTESDQSVIKLADSTIDGKPDLFEIIRSITTVDSGEKLLLVVDQFEELYVYCPRDQQQIFVEKLLSIAAFDGVTVLITLRADFLEQALTYGPFVEKLNPSQFILNPMNKTQLRDAVKKPAALMGVEFEEGLIERIIESSETSVGDLALVEFTLYELWERQQNARLTHAAYASIGGLKIALAAYAERIYNSLDEDEKVQVRSIFLQLVQPGKVQPGKQSKDTRRQTNRSEVGNKNWDLVVHLASKRLVVTELVVTEKDETKNIETVEIIHETLIREWARLRQWIEQNRDFRLWQEGVRKSIRRWETNDYQNDLLLLKDEEVNIANNWLEKRSEDLAKETEYIVKSSKYLEERQKIAYEKAKYLFWMKLIGSVVTLGLAAMIGVAWLRTNTSESNNRIQKLATSIEAQFDIYKQKKESLDSQSNYSREQMGKNIEQQKQNLTRQYQEILKEALKLGKELQGSNGVKPITRMLALTAMNKTVYEGNFGQRIKLSECSPRRGSVDLDITADGKVVACANDDGTIRIWDATTGKKINLFKGDTNWVNDVRFKSDSKTVAYGTVEGNVKLWNLHTHQPIKTLKGHLSEVNILSFSTDEKTIAAGNFDGTITLWSLETGQELNTFKGHADKVNKIRFSPDNQRLLSTSVDGTAILWDVKTAKALNALKDAKQYPSSVTEIYFDTDRPMVVFSDASSENTTLSVYNAYSSKRISYPIATEKVVLSPDGKLVASGTIHNGSDFVVLQNTATGRIFRNLSSQSLNSHLDTFKSSRFSNISSISFSPDSQMVAAVSGENVITLWNCRTGQKLKTFENAESISFSSDGKLIATLSLDRASHGVERVIRIWDIAQGKEIQKIEAMGDIQAIRFSPDNQVIADISNASSAQLWNLSKGKKINLPDLSSSDTNSYKYSSNLSTLNLSKDSKSISAVSKNDVISIRDIQTGKRLLYSIKQRGFPYDSKVKFSDDNKMLAARFSNDKNMFTSSRSLDKVTPNFVKIWDLISGKEIRNLEEIKKSTTAAKDGVREYVRFNEKTLKFSPNNAMIASIDSQGVINLWDIETGKSLKIQDKEMTPVMDVIFSPDNKIIAVAKTDDSIELWNFRDSIITNTFKHYSERENIRENINVSFSTDGKILMSLSRNTLKLWDVSTGEEIKVYDGVFSDLDKIKGMSNASFSSDDKTILFVNSDKDELIRWDLDLDNLLSIGCEKVNDKSKVKNLCKKGVSFINFLNTQDYFVKKTVILCPFNRYVLCSN